jgi:hypothetical protein
VGNKDSDSVPESPAHATEGGILFMGRACLYH